MIPFNAPLLLGNEERIIKQEIENHKICCDGEFTKKCNQKIEEMTDTKKALITTSGTFALEMAAILCDIQPSDEVIMQSYTFVLTANAFVLRGAKIVFIII
ncbi:aminotransferase class I/II-fold pyridoxal phosphate-dependent enzyme [Ruminococcus difficilis]|uniref:aminotransferase class I/II-fold pyridoxal phosphate-dependent enzyme n=1 Tax=Ruminococcus difficilis TaxID=2763069 RepID=UPI00344BAB38